MVGCRRHPHWTALGLQAQLEVPVQVAKSLTDSFLPALGTIEGNGAQGALKSHAV